ncbi:hypothetical protein L13192_12119 [Pyrenophora tritici-repentis]|uniref:Uncharacterized protein n=1 Tax=Pyrenophora tritici-repentis TaxID=45151 RepID=A0A922SS74_9PLEO|nr:hypothetical protein Ptr86124_005247 [Pyrenophora tritici-repentis]KAI1663722.1 hypothetical protein L13192_12119 [Pyrenophora tritici-repentis]KAI1678228.1 hypothetical protein KJE20_11836 [Pyrenophora tritici-repentis]
MTTRRPSTPKDAGPPRMPFASAEALIWGPELKKQHAYLLTEMRALQKQHEGYNARIQTTEAVAGAAEAATARIRHLEQKLVAIETEGDDKAFEKWAAEELARVSTFVDVNKNVRQKMIELDTVVSRVTEDVDGIKGVEAGFEGVMRRLEFLEHRRMEDAKKIQRLEGEMARVGKKEEEQRKSKSKERLIFGDERRLVGDYSIPGSTQSMTRRMESNHALNDEYPNPYFNPNRRTATPPQTLDADTSDSATEPDDDLMILPKSGLQFIPEEVQVPQSPVIQEKVPTSIDLTSPRKDLLSSARRRLFQRPSIHESKLPRLVGEGIQHTSPAHNEHSFLRNSPPAETQIVDRSLQAMAPLAQEAQPLPTNELPPTQIVNRAVPKKRKQSDPAPPTQRLTRSQAKKSREMEVKDEREQVPQPLVQSTQLPGPSISPRKKAKTDTAPAITNSKTKPTRAKQGAAKPRGRPRKEIVDAGSSEKKPVASTQPVAARPRKPRAKAAVSPTKKTAPIPAPQGAVSTVKQKRLMVTLPIPRKMPDSSLDGSENTQVSAGDRVKMSHQKAATTSPFKVIPKPLGTRSGNRQASPPAGQGEDDGELIPDEDDELLLA